MFSHRWMSIAFFPLWKFCKTVIYPSVLNSYCVPHDNRPRVIMSHLDRATGLSLVTNILANFQYQLRFYRSHLIFLPKTVSEELAYCRSLPNVHRRFFVFPTPTSPDLRSLKIPHLFFFPVALSFEKTEKVCEQSTLPKCLENSARADPREGVRRLHRPPPPPPPLEKCRKCNLKFPNPQFFLYSTPRKYTPLKPSSPRDTHSNRQAPSHEILDPNLFRRSHDRYHRLPKSSEELLLFGHQLQVNSQRMRTAFRVPAICFQVRACKLLKPSSCRHVF